MGIMCLTQEASLVIPTSRDMTFPPDSPFAKIPCFICDQPVSGDTVRTVTVVPGDGGACICGEIESLTYIMHAQHTYPDVDFLGLLIRQRVHQDNHVLIT